MFENREELRVEELGVEGLSDDSRLLDVDFFGDTDGRAYGWKEGLATVRSFRCKRCDNLPIPDQLVEGSKQGDTIIVLLTD